MMKKLLKIALCIFVIAFMISMCTDDSDTESQVDNQAEQNETVTKTESQTDESRNKTVDYSHVVVPFTKDGFPKTYQSWGKKWIDEINAMMPQAVNHVAKNDKCDEPYDIGLSIERSTPKKEAVFFVDCKNKERFYISQTELKEGVEVSAESEKLDEPSKYIQPCKKAIKAHLNHPNSFDEKLLSIRAYKGLSGNVVVEVPFTAKNGFGVEMEHTGRCVIDTRNNISVELQ